MWHKPCRTFHPWCPCIKTRCLYDTRSHIVTENKWVDVSGSHTHQPWWRHKMETFFAVLALCEENPTDSGVFPSQMPVMRIFGVFFDVRLSKRLIKLSRYRWFETPWCSSWLTVIGMFLIPSFLWYFFWENTKLFVAIVLTTYPGSLWFQHQTNIPQCTIL